MGTWKKFTDEEEQVIINKVKATPHNLSQAFREASLELGRSTDTIVQHWYAKRKHRAALKGRCGHCFIIYGGKSLNINRKIVSANSTDNAITISMDKLQKVLDILLDNN